MDWLLFKSQKKRKEDNSLHLRSVDTSHIVGNSISLKEYSDLKNASSKNKQNPFEKGPATDIKTRRSKFNAKKTELDGIMFDSKIESNRYIILKERLSLGIINDLDMQKKFDLIINDQKICSYLADFYYYCNERKMFVTEDVKGKRLPVYRLKKKLMKAILGIEILEIDKDNVGK